MERPDCSALRGNGEDIVADFRLTGQEEGFRRIEGSDPSKPLIILIYLMLNPMRTIEVPYGKVGVQKMEVPEENCVDILFPNEVETGDEAEEIENALDNPVDSPTLKEFLKGDEKTLFILNDATRPTPTGKILDVLSSRMNLSFPGYIVATGTHREPTEEEYEFILGDHYLKIRPRTNAHDAVDDSMAYLGRSKNGTEMWINERIVKADRLVIITSVEPHYFAGYTGGRKSIFPGVASYETTEQNHRLAMEPEAQSLALEGNPVHEDMMDALESLEDKPIFSIQVVMDRHHDVYKVVAGDIRSAFQEAVGYANEVFSVPIQEKYDVVVTVAPYPMDINLYQSQKALDNGKWALKEGGVEILVSKCRDGIGHTTFLEQLSLSDDPEEVLKNLSEDYKLGYHKAAKMAEIDVWAEMWGVTDLDPDLLRKAKIRPFGSLQAAMEAALQWKKDASVLVLVDGSVTVPRVE